jgi:hypothetical protein
MKLDASRRHSDAYFLEVKPITTGMPLRSPSASRGEPGPGRAYPIRQKLSKKPTSDVTSCTTMSRGSKCDQSKLTMLMIWSSLTAASLDTRPSSTSRMASMPWDETS